MASTKPSIGSQKFQVVYTKQFTPEVVYDQIYLHLYSSVLNYTLKDLMEVIVGEAKKKCELEQLESVLDESIPVKQRWKNLKGLVDSRQGLCPESYEKFLDVLVNLDHLNFRNFSASVRLYIEENFELEIKSVCGSNVQLESVTDSTVTQPQIGVVRPTVTEERRKTSASGTEDGSGENDGRNIPYIS